MSDEGQEWFNYGKEEHLVRGNSTYVQKWGRGAEELCPLECRVKKSRKGWIWRRDESQTMQDMVDRGKGVSLF